MRYTVSLIILLLCTRIGSAQDQIVTRSGDTIVCDITKVDKEYIYFSYNKSGKEEKTLIPHLDVLSFTNRNPNESTYFKPEDATNPSPSTPENKGLTRVRFGINFGPSYILANTSSIKSAFKEYYQKLRLGAQFNSNLSWYFGKYAGFGVQVNRFYSQNRADLIGYDNNGNVVVSSIQDNLTHQFYGLSWSTKYESESRKHGFHFISSLGWLRYVNQAAYFGKFTVTGGVPCAYFDMSYDLCAYKKFAVGANLGLTLGVITTFTYDDGFNKVTQTLPAGTGESVSRVDFGLGFRFLQ